MWEALSHITPFQVFLIIAATGFLFLLVTFLFGEILEGFEFGHDFDHELGHDGPGFFSVRVMNTFAIAFGGFGAIAAYQGYGVFVSLLIGLTGGFALAGAFYLFARFLYGQQSSSMVSSSELTGLKAQVIVSIPAEGYGQVRCLVGESMIDKIARSKDGAAIPVNSQVIIEEIAGESVIVSPWSTSGEWRGLFQ